MQIENYHFFKKNSASLNQIQDHEVNILCASDPTSTE